MDTGEPAVSTRVIEAVARRTGTDVVELPPLYDVVDPDALDALFDRGTAGGVVRFIYADRLVVVTGDGEVEVGPVPRGHEGSRAR